MATDLSPPPAWSYKVDLNTISEWVEDGSAVLESLQAQARAPRDMRTMRTFGVQEVLDLAGGQSLKKLRAYLEESGARSAAGSVKTGRLTLEQLHGFIDWLGLTPRRPAGSKTMILNICNYKGGAGKSQLTLHLSHYFGLKGWRTLVVDLDPQATLSRCYGLNPEAIEREQTMAPAFMALADDKPIPAPSIMSTHFPNIDIIPGSLYLQECDFAVATAFLRAGSGQQIDFYSPVESSLAKVEDAYDIIIIDTPPAYSFTGVAAMWAARGFVIPMPTAMSDFAATFDFLRMVLDTINSIAVNRGVTKSWNPGALVHSRVPTNAASQSVKSLASSVFGGHRLEEVILEMSAVANALGQFKSVHEATSGTVDSRSLKSGREAVNAVGSRIEGMIRQAWAEERISHE